MSSMTTFVVMLIHSVVIQVIIFAVRPVLSYATIELGASPAVLGIVAASYALPALVLAIPAGRLVDRLGERTSLILGASIVVVALAAGLGGLHSILLITGASVMLGIGQVLTVIGQQAFIGNIVSAKKSDHHFGYYGFAASAGQTIGPLLLALPAKDSTLPPLELILIICMTMSCLLLGLSTLIRSTSTESGRTSQPIWSSSRKVLTTPGMTRALGASAIVIATVDLFVAYAPLIGVDRGYSAVVVSLLLATRSVFSMSSRLALGIMTRRLGRRRLLVSSIFISSISLFLFSLPMPVVWLVVSVALYGFFVGICQPVTMSWISSVAPAGTRGLAMSFRLATNRLGQTVVPAGVGTLSAGWGASGVLSASGALLFLATWLSSAISPTVESDDDEDP